MVVGKKKRNKKNNSAASLRKWPAFCYAVLLTAIFLVFEQLDFFESADSASNEKLIQSLIATFADAPENKVPAILLFSDNATKLDLYGWPIRMDELWELIKDVYDSNAKSIFVDIAIRSADHDRKGFCELIGNMAGLPVNNGIDGFVKTLPDNCLDRNQIEDFIGHLILSNNSPIRILSEINNKEPQIIFAAPLQYLNKRNAYYNCDDCEDEHSIRDEFEQAIRDWPGVAYLDQVSILAPMNIATDGGRSARLWVDKAHHPSPAYIMACLQAGYSDSDCKQLNDSLDEETSYLMWRAGTDSDELLRKVYQQYPDCQSDGGSTSRFEQLVYRHISPVVAKPEYKLYRCPFYPTIDLASYITGRLTFETLENAVEGRSVIIGTDMRRFNDSIVSPVHGQLPGVFTHATSFDNLVNNKVFRAAGDFDDQSRRLAIVLDIAKYLLFCAVVWLFLVYKPVFFGGIDKSRTPLTYISLILLAAFTLFFIQAMSFEQGTALQRMGIILFYGFVVCVLLVAFFEKITCYFELNKKGERFVKKHIKPRRKGLYLLAPHIVVVAVLFLLLTLLGVLVSQFGQIAPPDVLSVFYYLLPLYMMAAREDITMGFAMLLGEQRIAELLLD